MLRFLADQNFNAIIVRGLRRRNPGCDIVMIQDTEADGAKDPEVLRWAARESRVLLTHDRATMPAFAYSRATGGEPMPGVVVVDGRLGVGSAMDDILLIAECMSAEEIHGRVLF